MDRYDFVVVGSGPAGFESALGLAKQGRSVAIVEKDELGGVCLNRGCIPTKVMVSAAKRLDRLDSGRRYGIRLPEVDFSYPDLVKYRKNVISRLRKGLEQKILDGGIRIFHGRAAVAAPDRIVIEDDRGREIALTGFDNLVIATGTHPVLPAGWAGINGVVDSEGFWNLDDMPRHVLIAGGGVIGCEYAASLAMLGCRVTVVESEERLLPREEPEISELIYRNLKSKGVTLFTASTVDHIGQQEGSLTVRVGEATLDVSLVVGCMGRTGIPDLSGLEMLAPDMSKAPSLRLKDNVWIAGDAATGPQLAHKAAHDAQIMVDQAAGRNRLPRYDRVPLAIFTSPEIGRAGLTEEEAGKSFSTETRRVNFSELGKAVADNAPQGFLKIVIDRKSRRILGMTVAGHEASEFSGYASLVLHNDMTVERLSEVVFSHPTLGEIFQECARRF